MNAAIIGALLLAVTTVLAHANDELDNWYTDPLPNFRSQLRDVAFGAGKWVMVGEKSWLSSDGKNWTPTTNLNASTVRYGNDQFVAVGSGTAYWTSTDAAKWHPRTFAFYVGLFAWSGTTFVIGADGAIFTSTDAVTWVRHEIPVQFASLRAVASDRYWVANGDGMWTSTNLVDWKRANAPSVSMPVLQFKGRYFARTFSGMHYSTNGIDWTVATSMTPIALGTHGDIALLCNGNSFYTSLNGTDWTHRSTPSSSLNFASDGRKVVIAANSNFFTSDSREAESPSIAAEIRAVVRIRGGRGRTYEIQSRAYAATGQWVTEDVVQAHSENFIWTDPEALGTKKIYRAVAR